MPSDLKPGLDQDKRYGVQNLQNEWTLTKK